MPISPSTPPEPELPATIGRYVVARLLGEGAMGRVLLAHDPVLDRDVAVKHLRSDLKIPRDVRAGLVTRMRHEARAAARVAHPNLVVLHDMGEDDGIGLYLVFEYVEGPTLKQRIAEGPLPAAEVGRLARDLGAALTLAHEAGILHRDVKPENVILARSGGKLADFGIARIPDSTLTHQGGLMGTPAYSAPETFRAGKFSPESDQFSLAASLYEALSGERAFPGDDAVAVAARIANDAPDPFAERAGLPFAVDEVFARALDRKPEQRYPSCAEMGRALADALGRPAERRAPASLPAAVSQGVTAAQPAALPVELPQERKTGQVIVGALVVVVTATLLVRTALRSAENDTESAAVVPTASHTASAPTPRPHPPAPPLIRPAAKPHPDPAPSGSAAPTVSAVAPSARPSAAASAGAAPTAPVTSASAAPPVVAPSATKIDANAPR